MIDLDALAEAARRDPSATERLLVAIRHELLAFGRDRLEWVGVDVDVLVQRSLFEIHRRLQHDAGRYGSVARLTRGVALLQARDVLRERVAEHRRRRSGVRNEPRLRPQPVVRLVTPPEPARRLIRARRSRRWWWPFSSTRTHTPTTWPSL